MQHFILQLTLTDDEIVEYLMFDVRFQHALHTTSFKEQPLSDKTLSGFRERCLSYEAITGINLVKNCIINLSTQIAGVMGINTGLKHMDSMMVASNIKKLSQLELLYTFLANLLKLLNKNKEDIPETMQHYCKPDDCNKVIYHMKNMDIQEKVDKVLYDASLLIKKRASNYDQSNEYQLLIRVIGEQAITDDNDTLTLKDKNDKTMGSTILQNPADPEATYRFKAGKQHHGCISNLTENVVLDKKISIISDYDYQSNTYSDSQFLKNTVEDSAKQTETLTLVADGAYGGVENIARAKEKNINLVTTNFQGTKPDTILANFEFNPDGTKVLKCAGGLVPIRNIYNTKSEQCRITMDKEKCNNCPYKDQCKPKFHKKKASKVLSWKSVSRSKQLKYMKTTEFIELAKIRNGVESLPSILRRKYHVDEIPVRGKLKTKLFFGFKVAALNFKKLLDYQNNLDNYTLKLELG